MYEKIAGGDEAALLALFGTVEVHVFQFDADATAITGVCQDSQQLAPAGATVAGDRVPPIRLPKRYRRRRNGRLQGPVFIKILAQHLCVFCVCMKRYRDELLEEPDRIDSHAD